MSAEGTAPPRPAKRRPDRRARILAAAMDLFHRNGYHATGMDDIGAAAGITGPGVYRHFESKEQILATGIRTAVGGWLQRNQDILAGAETPRAALDGLIANFVESLIADRWVSAVIMRERRALAPETRRWVDEAERVHIDAWVEALGRLRPDLPDEEARLIVHAGLWMCLCAAYYRSGVESAREAEMLIGLVRAALLRD
ncbi:MAG: TetR/AcrR family transcriptional regulator [Actinobacteria bacterium]|nr:TetR/AcrR family transcriptional regulator [Actinomycetota bacterium]